jgi:hypothetical protein
VKSQRACFHCRARLFESASPVLDRVGIRIEQLVSDVASCQKNIGAKALQIQTELRKLCINRGNLAEQQSRAWLTTPRPAMKISNTRIPKPPASKISAL